MRQFFTVTSLFFITLFFASCSSAHKKSHSDLYEEAVSYFDRHQDNKEYLFIRLYDPVYKNPLYVATFLKVGLAITEVNGFNASHASIGFGLDDNFFGLTGMTQPQLNFEQCHDTSGNGYMKNCDKRKSRQYTFAIKVTPQEFDRAMDIILNNLDVIYDNKINFEMAHRSVHRSHIRSDEDKKLENYNKSERDIDEINEEENAISPKNFVCSSFVGYILYNSVQSVHDFFWENHIDYHYLTVTDLATIPGVERLFDSKWANYQSAAKKCAKERPEFQPYLPGDDYS